MQYFLLLYLVAFAISFLIALLFTPYAKKLSVRLGAIDIPRARGMHKKPIPRMGGTAIVLGFMCTILILLPFFKDLRTLEFIGFVIGAIIIVILGMLDDMYSVKPKLKLIFQIIAALIVVFTGTTIQFANLPFSEYLNDISVPVTIIWIIAITNAVNLIDGIDGLAAGVSSISALCISVLCIVSGSYLGAILTITLAGSCFGFLPRNFSPAEIIMGDTGALFLGYVLAVTSIMGVYKSYALLSVVICAFVLALPIFDTLFAMIRRAINRKPIMQADRGHLHHRLIDYGFSTTKAVILLYIISAVSGIIAILIALRDIKSTVIVLILFFILSMMVFVYTKRLHKTEKEELQDEESIKNNKNLL